MRIANETLEQIYSELTEYDQIENDNDQCTININLLKNIVSELIIAYAKIDFLDETLEKLEVDNLTK